jgi:hypothetical protein
MSFHFIQRLVHQRTRQLILATLQMINDRGALKDDLWIKEQFKEAASAVQSISRSTTVVGFIMDSAAANRKAYQVRQKECKDGGSGSDDRNPKGPSILLQCASRTLSLLIKDITEACSWVSKVFVDSVAICKAVSNNERTHDLYVQACAVKDAHQL